MRRFILNCDPSTGVQQDWTFADAVEAGVVSDAAARAEVDLRGGDWPVCTRRSESEPFAG